jgi:hypothetical protein
LIIWYQTSGAYPDALEYTDDNQKTLFGYRLGKMWKEYTKTTGVKIDMPMHRLFRK